MKSSSAGLFRFRPDDGRCELLSFDSPFKTVNPALRDSYPKARRNMRAVAQYWRHDNGPRPTICVIHGFMADPYWVNRLFFALPWFYAQGYDILLYTLPHHGKRRSALSPFSGHGLFAGGLGGVFLLGIFSKRANGAGALFGLLASGILQYLIKEHTGIHLLMYAFTGMFMSILIGWLASIVAGGGTKEKMKYTYSGLRKQ